ncbi:MAG: hypothetical protein ABFD64_10285 [Armatimonadota bacterium]
MKECYTKKLSRAFKTAVVVAVALGFGLAGASVSNADTSIKQDGAPIVKACKADLAKRLKKDVGYIELASYKPATWPNTAMGMPEIGKTYNKKNISGAQIILETDSIDYAYNTDGKSLKYLGPVTSWLFSLLYLKPVPNDPNFNGDLYQCSFFGTNSQLIASAVTEFYPQKKGGVVVKRRMSRSGHDLLFLNAGDPSKVQGLYSALDFSDVAVNDAQNRWAAYIRPRLGTSWAVVAGGIGKDGEKPYIIPLPDDVNPDKIAWSGDMLMIMVSKDGKPREGCFEILPKDGATEWNQANYYDFPSSKNLILSRSETLEVNQIDVNGKPAVEVARVWFTGATTVVTQIEGLTLGQFELVGKYVVISGERDSKPVVCTVDVHTGEIIPCASGVGQNVKAFDYPLKEKPLAK